MIFIIVFEIFVILYYTIVTIIFAFIRLMDRYFCFHGRHN